MYIFLERVAYCSIGLCIISNRIINNLIECVASNYLGLGDCAVTNCFNTRDNFAFQLMGNSTVREKSRRPETDDSGPSMVAKSYGSALQPSESAAYEEEFYRTQAQVE